MSFQAWNLDSFPLPGLAKFDRVHQSISAVSRKSDCLDLFVIGFDNRVWSTFWNGQSGWNADWFTLPGETVFDRATQKVAVVSRAPGNLDLFVIGFDNHVWSTFWNDRTGWNREWFRLPGDTIFDHTTQHLAVVSRAESTLDLFVIGFDDHVWSTFWNDQTGWNREWFRLPGQTVFDHERQQLAVVTRAPGNLDLFVIGFDDHVWSTFWNDRTGWNPDWFRLPGAAVFDRANQKVAAVSRAPGNLDLFLIGNDNHIWTTFWNDRTGWSPDWFPVPGEAVFDRVNQRLAAVSRAPDWLQTFVIGNDNHGWTTFWGPRLPMTLNVTMDRSPQTDEVPFMAGLHIAASPGLVVKTTYAMSRNGVVLPEIGQHIPGGIALDRLFAINDPGTYVVTVSRQGFVGTAADPVTLSREFTIVAKRPRQPGPKVVPPKPPVIQATISGTVASAKIHVKGSGFRPNRPAGSQGIRVRFVDANNPASILNGFAPSSATGTIDQQFEINLSGLVINAAGRARLAISATDGTLVPTSVSIDGFLWSNTVPLDFP